MRGVQGKGWDEDEGCAVFGSRHRCEVADVERWNGLVSCDAIKGRGFTGNWRTDMRPLEVCMGGAKSRTFCTALRFTRLAAVCFRPLYLCSWLVKPSLQEGLGRVHVRASPLLSAF